jgi:hypothetical protein
MNQALQERGLGCIVHAENRAVLKGRGFSRAVAGAEEPGL